MVGNWYERSVDLMCIFNIGPCSQMASVMAAKSVKIGRINLTILVPANGQKQITAQKQDDEHHQQ